MEKIRKNHFDNDIKNYIIHKNVIYIGGSCGAHIVSKSIKHVEVFEKNNVGLSDFTGLGLLNGILIPHYNEERKQIYKKYVKSGNDKVYFLTDDDSLVVNNDDILFWAGKS